MLIDQEIAYILVDSALACSDSIALDVDHASVCDDVNWAEATTSVVRIPDERCRYLHVEADGIAV